MTMLEKPLVSEFSHVKPGETPWRSDGLRDFFLYRDLGVAEQAAGADHHADSEAGQVHRPQPLAQAGGIVGVLGQQIGNPLLAQHVHKSR